MAFYDDSAQSGANKDKSKQGIYAKIKSTKSGYGLAEDMGDKRQLSQCVAFLGLPNSGKSSLLNKLANQELCAVSSKSHTTNQNVLVV